jgi:creatinine amidohydrolase/Fe(II)-dependent formamide hydrolase-like protein
MAPLRRALADLTSPEAARHIKESSVLCWPLGAIEQHGSHLPLATDVIVAEALTRRIVARWGEEFDLWQLPAFPIGLSREHDWAAGTLSLSIQSFVAVMRDMACTIASALPARNLAIINGHGGNRGALDNLLHEFAGDFGLNCCAIHPFDLPKAEASADVHGGRSETSVMLAVAPELVRKDLIAPAAAPPDEPSLRALIFDRGASFPWRTDDPRLARAGIVGSAHEATAELGAAIVASIVEEAGRVFTQLLANRKAGRS